MSFIFILSFLHLKLLIPLRWLSQLPSNDGLFVLCILCAVHAGKRCISRTRYPMLSCMSEYKPKCDFVPVRAKRPTASKGIPHPKSRCANIFSSLAILFAHIPLSFCSSLLVCPYSLSSFPFPSQMNPHRLHKPADEFDEIPLRYPSQSPRASDGKNPHVLVKRPSSLYRRSLSSIQIYNIPVMSESV